MSSENPHIIKPRVFVSSVVKNFEDFRAAARQGTEQAGGEPVLVNEDFPALATSSRNACLDGVDSADIFKLLIGERGGWKTPSGKLVVEEELERARKSKLPIIVFLQDTKRDEDAQQLASFVSDYVDGFFRKTFTSPQDLLDAVRASLHPLVENKGNEKMNTIDLIKYFEEPYTIQNECSVRLVVAPERQEEVINPVQLESKDFIRKVREIGHSSKIELFDYQYPNTYSVEFNSLVFHQDSGNRHRQATKVVRLEIGESGVIVIDTNVTG